MKSSSSFFFYRFTLKCIKDIFRRGKQPLGNIDLTLTHNPTFPCACRDNTKISNLKKAQGMKIQGRRGLFCIRQKKNYLMLSDRLIQSILHFASYISKAACILRILIKDIEGEKEAFRKISFLND